jgi:hypothetical protein
MIIKLYKNDQDFFFLKILNRTSAIPPDKGSTACVSKGTLVPGPPPSPGGSPSAKVFSSAWPSMDVKESDVGLVFAGSFSFPVLKGPELLPISAIDLPCITNNPMNKIIIFLLIIR